MKGISLQKTYLSLIIVLNHPEIKHYKKIIFITWIHVLVTKRISLWRRKQQDAAVETKYFVFSKPRHNNIFCGVFHENVELKKMYPIKFANSTVQRPAQTKLRIRMLLIVSGSDWRKLQLVSTFFFGITNFSNDFRCSQCIMYMYAYIIQQPMYAALRPFSMLGKSLSQT